MKKPFDQQQLATQVHRALEGPGSHDRSASGHCRSLKEWGTDQIKVIVGKRI
jgi:hypothetical protein